LGIINKMKKQLKPLRHRKPKVTTTTMQMLSYISEDTGFTKDDIQLVLRSMISYIRSSMLKGFGVSLPKLGIFYPLIKPSRTVMSMNGGVGAPEKMKMSDRWQMKFKSSETVDRELAEKKVTKKQIDNLYN
tara:strand:+ start:669 stop:1061 length:393 start_codon:yes stop_codon:yes gene_type:complete